MKRIILYKNKEILTENAQLADTFFSRFRGLMFRKEIAGDYALLIVPCNQIHMLNMRFAIDVIYLDKNGRVVQIDMNVQPNKICKTVKNAHSVIEMKSFASENFGINVGDMINVRDKYEEE